MNRYKIVVRYFSSKSDLADGFYKLECESGFTNLSLSEAQTCLNKISNENVGTLIRQNLIVLEDEK